MMKIITLLLALVMISGHMQNGKADEPMYSLIEQIEQPEQQAPDKVMSCLGFLEAICTMTKCVLPVVDLEFKGLTPIGKQSHSLIEGGKEFHFEAPGMFSVSIRE